MGVNDVVADPQRPSVGKAAKMSAVLIPLVLELLSCAARHLEREFERRQCLFQLKLDERIGQGRSGKTTIGEIQCHITPRG